MPPDLPVVVLVSSVQDLFGLHVDVQGVGLLFVFTLGARRTANADGFGTICDGTERTSPAP